MPRKLRSERFTIRVSPTEYDVVRARAGRANLKPGPYIRSLMFQPKIPVRNLSARMHLILSGMRELQELLGRENPKFEAVRQRIEDVYRDSLGEARESNEIPLDLA